MRKAKENQMKGKRNSKAKHTNCKIIYRKKYNKKHKETLQNTKHCEKQQKPKVSKHKKSRANGEHMITQEHMKRTHKDDPGISQTMCTTSK